MSNKNCILPIFMIGAVAGSICTWLLLRRKYELIAQEEINSVKATYSVRGGSFKAVNPFSEDCHKNIKESADDSQEEEDLKKYAAIIQEEGYVDYSRITRERGAGTVKKPYVISPEEFGEFEEYEQISLTYYADKVLTDEDNEKVDKVEEIIGEESLTHFGEYEDDSVFVRNERLKIDYEILLDRRNYSEVIKTDSCKMEE